MTPTALIKALTEKIALYPSGEVVGPCVCGSWPGGPCLRCDLRISPFDLEALLSHIEEMRRALEEQTAFVGELLSAARSDIAAADPADVGMSGVPVVAWRKAYAEGCNDMASGIVSRMPSDLREAAAASVRAALQSKEPRDAE